MRLLRRLAIRVAYEVSQNPAARAKLLRVMEEKVKPGAQKVWRESQPKVAEARSELKRFARKVRDEYRKGRTG